MARVRREPREARLLWARPRGHRDKLGFRLLYTWHEHSQASLLSRGWESLTLIPPFCFIPSGYV